MHVRQAEPDDAADVQRVAATSTRAAYAGVVDDETIVESVEGPSFMKELADWLAEAADREDVVYLVGDDGDGVVGFAQFTWGDACREGYVGDDEALLHSLYVAPDRWREGAGTALLERGVERLPDRLDRLKLGVLPDNDVGRSFYDDHGFEAVGEDVYEMGAASYDVLVLARDL